MTTNWRKLNKELALMTEAQVLELLTLERSGERRSSLLGRLHQRYTMLRAMRERKEILHEARSI